MSLYTLSSRHVTRMNASCHMYLKILQHSMNHVTLHHYTYFRHAYERVLSQVSLLPVTYMHHIARHTLAVFTPCSVSQCIAVCHILLQYVAVYCSVLQHVAVCCSVLQRVVMSLEPFA